MTPGIEDDIALAPQPPLPAAPMLRAGLAGAAAGALAPDVHDDAAPMEIEPADAAAPTLRVSGRIRADLPAEAPAAPPSPTPPPPVPQVGGRPFVLDPPPLAAQHFARAAPSWQDDLAGGYLRWREEEDDEELLAEVRERLGIVAPPPPPPPPPREPTLGAQLMSGLESLNQMRLAQRIETAADTVAEIERIDAGEWPRTFRGIRYLHSPPAQRAARRARWLGFFGEEIAAFLRSQARLAALPRVREADELVAAIDRREFRRAWEIFNTRPGGIAQQMIAESLPAVALSSAAALATAPLGPVAVGAGQLALTAAMTRAQTFAELLTAALQERQVDLTDPDAVMAALRADPAIAAAAGERAGLAASGPAVAAALAMAFARGIRPSAGALRNAGAVAANVVAQTVAAAGGEAARQWLLDQELQLGRIAAQAATALPMAATATAVGTVLARNAPPPAFGIRSRLMARIDGRTLYQPLNDIETLRRMAAAEQPALYDTLHETIRGIDGVEISTRLKTLDTILEKLSRPRSPYRVPAEIGDYLGGRLVFDDIGVVPRLIDRLMRTGRIVEVDNFLESGRGPGYRAIHLQIRMRDGFTAEIQIMPREMAQAQDAGHGFYEVLRRGGLTGSERLRLARQEAEIFRRYSDLWDQRRRAGAPPPRSGSN